MGPTTNFVWVTGKVSRLGALKYTPSGVPLCEFTVAIPQEYFGKPSVGYFEVLLCGKAAEEEVGQIKIGQTLKLKGSLWSRTYKNRQGVRLSETKILIGSIKGESHEKS